MKLSVNGNKQPAQSWQDRITKMQTPDLEELREEMKTYAEQMTVGNRQELMSNLAAIEKELEDRKNKEKQAPKP
ncbi:hypothetical protein [Xanthocytophaga flava]|uniref:hypothetical protein n=1 Tax=Xanthocytophaga flava TaxID=3048013 RepID=UPI0028D7FCBC|nr:hypothetical protein [Xanthocytophaga flavus]MDJ1468195.1 hypothetical protein [Xanthocytophaga flavus]